MPLPDPNYSEVDDPDEGREAFGGVNIDCDGGKIHSAGWMVKFCETAAGDIVHSAATNVSFWSTEATHQCHNPTNSLNAYNQYPLNHAVHYPSPVTYTRVLLSLIGHFPI